tara:strand:- start:1606 stop:2232 length:627 start_codon:yes stop_codon:yes gene_type:complete
MNGNNSQLPNEYTEPTEPTEHSNMSPGAEIIVTYVIETVRESLHEDTLGSLVEPLIESIAPQCLICLHNINIEEIIPWICPQCNIPIHKKCIGDWVLRKSSCPHCIYDISIEEYTDIAINVEDISNVEDIENNDTIHNQNEIIYTSNNMRNLYFFEMSTSLIKVFSFMLCLLLLAILIYIAVEYFLKITYFPYDYNVTDDITDDITDN